MQKSFLLGVLVFCSYEVYSSNFTFPAQQSSQSSQPKTPPTDPAKLNLELRPRYRSNPPALPFATTASAANSPTPLFFATAAAGNSPTPLFSVTAASANSPTPLFSATAASANSPTPLFFPTAASANSPTPLFFATAASAGNPIITAGNSYNPQDELDASRTILEAKMNDHEKITKSMEEEYLRKMIYVYKCAKESIQGTPVDPEIERNNHIKIQVICEIERESGTILSNLTINEIKDMLKNEKISPTTKDFLQKTLEKKERSQSSTSPIQNRRRNLA